MADWMIWFILAGALVGLEIFTGTFYLLMVGLGFAAGGVAALLGGSAPWQFLIAAVFGVLGIFFLRRNREFRFTQDAASDPNVNLDIGQTIAVATWHDQGNGCFTSRAMYRGSMWDVDLQHGASPQAGIFIIREVHGSRLLVSNYSEDVNPEEA